MTDPDKIIMTMAEFADLPEVEGPDLSLTADEIREMNRPKPNGGIHFEGCLAVWGGQCSCHNLPVQH